MIIMALDHVRDYFHKDAWLYDPTDLTRTSVALFFTRWITHFCAPIFVFLAGLAACLYGGRRTRQQLSFFLFTRGVWLVFAELFIISLERTFNPHYPFFLLQVIWVTGISMMVLSGMVYLKRSWILALGVLLIAGHNLLDSVHVSGNGTGAVCWSILHEPREFVIGGYTLNVLYPLLPWIGILAIGYCCGSWYSPLYEPRKRRKSLLYAGCGALALFILLRGGNFYGDAALWSTQRTVGWSVLSFIKVTKYPPSLLYTLVTLGSACIFLAFSEKPLNALTAKITVYGRVPMFYYLLHFLLIHVLAVFAARIEGYSWSVMVLTGRVNKMPELKGYGFGLGTVYLVWISVVLLLYPCCKWFDRYKRANVDRLWWLSYL